MTVGREKFTELLDKFRAISEPYITHEVIQRLKEENKNKINSARVWEKINDIKTLIRVLEKRGIVQYNDISTLRHIARDFVKDKAIEQLISHYDKWLEQNSANVNYFYSCGKSQALLNQNNINKCEISETENSCHNLQNVINNKSEENQIKCEQYSEPLLPKEPSINIASSNFTIVNERKPLKITKKRCIISLTISLILVILLILIIWFIVKMCYQSAAIIPEVDRSLQTSTEPNRSSMTNYVSNINIGITTQSFLGTNQTQNTAKNVPTAPVDVEKEIQDIIIKKISKRIGKFWKDVCRQLNVSEGEIIEIERDDTRGPRTVENMFKQALQMYFLDHHPNWRIDLMNALTKSNRNDLKDTVLEIFSQKHFQ